MAISEEYEKARQHALSCVRLARQSLINGDPAAAKHEIESVELILVSMQARHKQTPDPDYFSARKELGGI